MDAGGRANLRSRRSLTIPTSRPPCEADYVDVQVLTRTRQLLYDILIDPEVLSVDEEPSIDEELNGDEGLSAWVVGLINLLVKMLARQCLRTFRCVELS
jgi:hypothetical protein